MLTTKEHSLDQVERLKSRQRRPATPGDLLADLMECNELTQGEVAERTGVSRATINRIIQGHRAMTPELAHRLGRFFGNGPGIWMKFQQQVDLWDTLHMDSTQYHDIQPLTNKAA